MQNGILGLNFQNVVLHLLNFVILSLGLYKLLYKPVKEFMEKRTKYYEELELSKKKALEEAQELLEENKKKLESVQDEISSMKKQVLKDAEIEAHKKIESAKKEEAEIIERAKQAALFEKNKVLEENRKEIKQLVLDAFEKTSKKEIDEFDSFINSYKVDEEHEQN